MKLARLASPFSFLLAASTAAFSPACASVVGARGDAEPDAMSPDALSPDARAPDVVARDAIAPRPDAVVATDAAPAPVDARDSAPPDPPPACDPHQLSVRTPGLANLAGGTVVFVARRLNFGFESRDLWGTHGLDRDGLCTDPATTGTAGGSCRPRGTTQPPQDGFRGRDNSFAPRLGGALQGAGWTEAGANDAITAGAASIALRISDYGGDDDGNVLVEWLPVIHGHRPGDPAARPRFDGVDQWHVDRRTAYASDGGAVIRSPGGFVEGTTLRFDVPSRAPLRLPGARSPIRLRLSAGKLFGPLTRSDDGATTFGPVEFSGIWPLADALEDLWTFGVCPRDTLTYTFVTGALQGAADLLGTLELGPMIECDAVSVAFGMEFTAATLGPDEESPPVNEDLCAGR